MEPEAVRVAEHRGEDTGNGGSEVSPCSHEMTTLWRAQCLQLLTTFNHIYSRIVKIVFIVYKLFAMA